MGNLSLNGKVNKMGMKPKCLANAMAKPAFNGCAGIVFTLVVRIGKWAGITWHFVETRYLYP